MPKFICIIHLLLICYFSIGQQHNGKLERFNYGLVGGANFSTIKIENGRNFYRESTSSKGRSSYHFGAFLSWNVRPKTNVVLQPSYSKKGGDINLTIGPYPGGTVQYQLDYLSIPVLFRQGILPKINIEIGTEISFLIKQSGLKVIDGRDLSIVAGAGYYLKPKIMVNFRYNYGLKNINKFPNEKRIGDWYNLSSQISFNYTLGKL